MKKIGKYEFNDSVQADSKINAFDADTQHTFIRLGYIVLEDGEYDVNGEQTKAPVLSDKYHVDVLWKGIEEHPRGWKTYAVDVDGNGVHSFLGLDYNEYKL